MTDTAFLSSSPWLSELLSPRDDLLSGDYDLVTDLPFHNLDSESSVPGTDLWNTPWDVSCVPSDISIAPSDCSDQTSVDLDLEERMFAASEAGANTGLLTSAAVSAISDGAHNEDLSLTQEICRWQDGLVTSDNNEDRCDILYGQSDDDDDDSGDEDLPREAGSVTLGKPEVSARKRSLSETLSPNIKWSLLSCREQHQLVLDLSTLISSQLGLREQLEVIRILNPRATVSPTDSEFVIDTNRLCDEKLQRVQAFVKQHVQQSTGGNQRFHHSKNNNNNNSKNNNSKGSTSCSHRHESQHSKKCCCQCDGHSYNVSSNMSEDAGTRRRRRGVKHPTTFLTVRERRRLERKRSRQDQKERRSGLFTHEEVLSVSSHQGTPQEDDDDPDIDILT